MKEDDIVDLSYLKETTQNDENFIQEMIRTFLENLPKQLNFLEEGIKKEHWKNIRKGAHDLKSSTRMIGVKGARELFSKIEQNASKQSALDLIQKDFVSAKEACQQASDYLQKEFI